MSTNIEEKIRDMNREILKLKTAHSLKSNMKTFYGNYTLPNDDDGKTHRYEITYVEGEQPILSSIIGVEYSGSFKPVTMMEPTGNKQILLDMNAHHSNSTKIVILSTRQIVGFRRIS